MGHKLPLGEKGRRKLKTLIGSALRRNPELKEKVKKIANLRRATTSELLEIATVCNIRSVALQISQNYLLRKKAKSALVSSSKHYKESKGFYPVSPNPYDSQYALYDNFNSPRSSVMSPDSRSTVASPSHYDTQYFMRKSCSNWAGDHGYSDCTERFSKTAPVVANNYYSTSYYSEFYMDYPSSGTHGVAYRPRGDCSSLTFLSYNEFYQIPYEEQYAWSAMHYDKLN